MARRVDANELLVHPFSFRWTEFTSRRSHNPNCDSNLSSLQTLLVPGTRGTRLPWYQLVGTGSLVVLLRVLYYYSSSSRLLRIATSRLRTAQVVYHNQWPLAGGTPTTLYSIWTYDNDRNLKYLTNYDDDDRNLKYLTRVNSNPYDLLPIFGPMMMIVT